ncbi:hypothetical protein BDN72DRAFT_880275 [Pluteus cervinus]|uniref:Uncharacterized protein n=1 Tax=Pluteus cervinus TaxID=181527 RepID=A0ACD3ALK3_9AGAR|nr:hypothetical protein BDN72DRAFT_880275 [Pluteus cervinus]
MIANAEQLFDYAVGILNLCTFICSILSFMQTRSPSTLFASLKVLKEEIDFLKGQDTSEEASNLHSRPACDVLAMLNQLGVLSWFDCLYTSLRQEVYQTQADGAVAEFRASFGMRSLAARIMKATSDAKLLRARLTISLDETRIVVASGRVSEKDTDSIATLNGDPESSWSSLFKRHVHFSFLQRRGDRATEDQFEEKADHRSSADMA